MIKLVVELYNWFLVWNHNLKEPQFDFFIRMAESEPANASASTAQYSQLQVTSKLSWTDSCNYYVLCSDSELWATFASVHSCTFLSFCACRPACLLKVFNVHIYYLPYYIHIHYVPYYIHILPTLYIGYIMKYYIMKSRY